MKAIKQLVTIFFFIFMTDAYSEIVAKEGKGFLEKVDGQYVLHVSGSSFEMGFQHGKLLKEKIQSNIKKYIDQKKPELEDRLAQFEQNLDRLLAYTPNSYQEEMMGIAEGSGIPYEKILKLNMFPEMFHCSGITASGDATKNGDLYHVRLLDYSIGKEVQNTAVLIVAEPDDKHAFLNVSYAGFIGVVTGMNDKKISVGEIGGQGYGNWKGMPMSFLLRQVLETSSSLELAKKTLEETPRTCEYYYVIADGNSLTSIGVYATESQIHFIPPGNSYALLAPHNLPKNYGLDGRNDKFFVSPYRLDQTSHQLVVYDEGPLHIALFHNQPKDTVLLTGYTYPERYPVLVERVLASYGSITLSTLQEIIKEPVARPSNLHNAIFHPATLEVWVSHAGKNNEPACSQQYYHFSLSELLKK